MLASVHGATEKAAGLGIRALETCIRIVDEKPELPRNVLEIVTADDVS